MGYDSQYNFTVVPTPSQRRAAVVAVAAATGRVVVGDCLDADSLSLIHI